MSHVIKNDAKEDISTSTGPWWSFIKIEEAISEEIDNPRKHWT